MLGIVWRLLRGARARLEVRLFAAKERAVERSIVPGAKDYLRVENQETMLAIGRAHGDFDARWP